MIAGELEYCLGAGALLRRLIIAGEPEYYQGTLSIA